MGSSRTARRRDTVRAWVLFVIVVGVAVSGLLWWQEGRREQALDGHVVSEEISRQLSRQLEVGVDVTCPEVIPARRGRITDCAAIADGSAESWGVRVTADDDEGHYSWELSGQQVSGSG